MREIIRIQKFHANIGGAGEAQIQNNAPYPLFKAFLPYSTPVTAASTSVVGPINGSRDKRSRRIARMKIKYKSSINTRPEAQKRNTTQNRAQYERIGGRALKTAKNETGVQSTFRDIYNVAQCIFYDLYIFETRTYEQSSI